MVQATNVSQLFLSLTLKVSIGIKKIIDSLFQEICPVHSTILPKTHWSYFSTPEELDELIETLNVRGIREHELREKLVHDREKIVRVLKPFLPGSGSLLFLPGSRSVSKYGLNPPHWVW